MSKTRILSAVIIAAMRDAGWLRNDGYRLKEGFNKVLTIEDVKESKTRGAKENNNFRIIGETEDGPVTIPGGILANARLLPADTVIEDDGVKPGVWYRDELEGVLVSSQVFNEAKGMDGGDFEFPEKIEIVGAMVDEDPDVKDSPRFPLRSFKHYNTVLRHHRKLVGDDTAFMTRDEFKAYIEASEDRPKGVPESYTELELVDSIDKDDMRNWQFTLLIKDVK